jgi:hypothetical protein
MRRLPPAFSVLAVLAVLAALAALAACERDSLSPGFASHARPSEAVAAANQADADAISSNIQRWHVPYGTVIDPIFADSNPSTTALSSAGYDRAADAALWTGSYLAAEAFRYKVTRSARARHNAQGAVAAIARLLDVTGAKNGANVLARFAVPTADPYADAITGGESKHGIYAGSVDGVAYRWLGNTSRDQYSGVFFGLGVAYDMIDDGPTRADIRRDVERLLDYLLATRWNVVMPDGTIATTFLARPEQQLSFLQVGRRVNAAKYGATYQTYRAAFAGAVVLPIASECTDPYDSYFKFNLDYMNLYNLVRMEESTSRYRATYLTAYNTLRACTGSHRNAHFDMIDRALEGPAAARDAEAVDLLGRWLLRRRRDYPTDVTAKYSRLCGTNRACTPVSVEDRPNTDFLWQRSPFLVAGGKSGRQETAGIDYILPYWMARHYGVVTP